MDRLSCSDISALRERHYNATVTQFRLVHEELLILRVRPDAGRLDFQAGQYTTLGLGYWEPRADGCDLEPMSEVHEAKVVQRAYSISSPILDDSGQPVRVHELDELEFYVALIRHSKTRIPALTPRLFALHVGSRLFVGTHPKGHYTLEPVGPDDYVVFLATGTGEAPHNAMLGELLARGHQGRIVNAVSVRYGRDLAYQAVHRLVESRWRQYRYVALTTREPRNVDPSDPQFVGKVRLQDFIASGRLAESLGTPLDPTGCHVFLCGNPEMVGIPEIINGEPVYPQPVGAIEVLERIGFRADRPEQSGNIHFEKYW